jgi:hypothetical protein
LTRSSSATSIEVPFRDHSGGKGAADDDKKAGQPDEK